MAGRNFDANIAKYKFTGKERDKESNYDYFGARYYDARIGRWGSIDPMLEKHYDFNPYNYVLDNSLKFIDPEGMQVDPGQKFAEEQINKELNKWEKAANDIINKGKEITKSIQETITPFVARVLVNQTVYRTTALIGVGIISQPSIALMVATSILVYPDKVNVGEDEKLKQVKDKVDKKKEEKGKIESKNKTENEREKVAERVFKKLSEYPEK